MSKKTARACAVFDLTDLARLVVAIDLEDDPPIWNLSHDFLDCDSIDDPCYLPLSNVKFDKNTRRYCAPDAPDLNEDDWLLHALVMMVLYYRLEHGEGVLTMLRHLTVWDDPSPKHHRLTALTNLWEEEIEQLKKTPLKPGSKLMKLGKGLKHKDNFDTFQKFYCTSRPGRTDKWARRPENSQNYSLHVLAEQAAVQWALDQENPHLMDLAALVIRIQRKQAFRTPTRLPNLLREQAEKAGCDGGFVKLALDAIQEHDWEGDSTEEMDHQS